MYVLVGMMPPLVLPTKYELVTLLCCPLCICRFVWRHPLVLRAIFVLVVVVPPRPCVSRYVCAGWCGATRLCCPQGACWLILLQTLVLPAMYVLVGLVTPLVFCVIYVLVGIAPPLVSHSV